MPEIKFKLEPRDIWVGVFWDRHAIGGVRIFDVYICVLPCLPIRLRWVKPAPAGGEARE